MVTIFGKYEIVEELGAGAFGIVYRAEDTSLGRRTVALKVLNDQASGDPEYAGWFRREAATAAQLVHPNIITIHSFGENDGQLFVDMRFITGETLASLIERESPMEIADIVPILTQLAAALDYAHSKLVVHRDVKRGNVMVESNGQVVLCDFGIARRAINTQLGQITSLPNKFGTPQFLAPEQWLDQVPGPPVDRYALGVIAFEMLTGKLPFGSPNDVVNMPMPGIRVDRPDVPLACEQAIARMLSKEPAGRYRSAGAFVEALASGMNQAKLAPVAVLQGVAPSIGDLVVDRGGAGVFRTISEALLNATPASVIRVRPGTYRETVTLTTDVTIVAEGRPGDVVLWGDEQPAIRVNAGRPLLRGLTLRAENSLSSSARAPAIRVTGGSPSFVGCHVSSLAGRGVEIAGPGTDALMQDCEVGSCANSGILIDQSTKGTFERCSVRGTPNGFEVRQDGNPSVRDCVLTGNDIGILVYRNGRGTFDRCDVIGSNSSGIEVRDGGDPVVRNCTFRDSKGRGANILATASGTMTDCTFISNLSGDWVVEEGAGGTRTGNSPEASS